MYFEIIFAMSAVIITSVGWMTIYSMNHPETVPVPIEESNKMFWEGGF